ncbi:cation efflux family protein [Ancylostoma caninum]|uniref:Cation efflux family protein n=1 Tax=Ancylostoma caninum TaxID=29170 RepID=A0A368GZW0_ANCCA|nr:cation efflux family protein [Ancylostoma caninum]
MVLFCNRSKVGVRKFYEKQNDLLEAWKEDEKVLTSSVDHAAEAAKDQRVKVWDTRLATITIILNVFLIIAKTTAAILSDSLSVVASVVDSAMDITSGLVLWYTCRLIERSNKHHYPVGLNRLEPLTTLIVGLIMIFANLLVLQEAAVDSVTGNLHPKVDIPTLVILCTGTSIKAVLFLVCRSRNTSASRVLAIDQRNDCITNLVALADTLTMVICCNRAKVGVRKFYEKQNDLLEAWKEDEKVLTSSVDHAAEAAKDQRVKVGSINY